VTSRGISRVAAIAVVLVSCQPTGVRAPSPAPTASTGPVPEGCPIPPTGDVLVGGFRTADGRCVPPGRMVAVRCDTDATPLVARGLGRRRRLVYLGGRFAVPVRKMPEGSVPMGVNAVERVYGIDGQLYVDASGTISRWLALPLDGAVSGGPDATMIGDSILDGARTLLPDALPRWMIVLDAKIGRDSSAGYPLVVSAPASDPEVVVIELGTNDEDPSAFATNAEAMLSALPEVPLVLWVVPHGPGSLVPTLGRAVREAVAEHPNAATADWDTFVPDDALADGVHLLPERQGLFPEFLAPYLNEWLAAARGRGPAGCLDAVRGATGV
jgi:hypothetical protein